MFLSSLLTGMSFAALKDLQSGGGLNVQSISEEVHRHNDAGAVYVEADGSIHMMSDANAASNRYQAPPSTMEMAKQGIGMANTALCSGRVGIAHAPPDLLTNGMQPTSQLRSANRNCDKAKNLDSCKAKQPAHTTKPRHNLPPLRHDYFCVWMSATPGGTAKCKPCFYGLNSNGTTQEELNNVEVQRVAKDFAKAQAVLNGEGEVTEDVKEDVAAVEDAALKSSADANESKGSPESTCAKFQSQFMRYYLCLAYQMASDFYKTVKTHIGPHIS